MGVGTVFGVSKRCLQALIEGRKTMGTPPSGRRCTHLLLDDRIQDDRKIIVVLSYYCQSPDDGDLNSGTFEDIMNLTKI